MFDRGIRLLKKGDLEGAKKYYQKILNKERNKTALFELGKIYFKEGNTLEAKKYFIEFIKMHPKPEEIKNLIDITNAIKITDFGFYTGPAVFSVNRLLAYTKARDTNLDGKLDIFDRPGLYIYDLKRKQEWNISEDIYYNSSPQFSPDGRFLCFLSARNENPTPNSPQGLYIYEIEKNAETKIVDEKLNPKSPKFSYDGNYIYFIAQPAVTNPNRGLFKVDIKTGALYTLIRESFDVISFDINDKGAIVYAQRRDERFKNYSIFLKNPDGSEKELAPKEFVNEAPQFSPDGKKIIYLSTRRDTNKDGVIDTLDNPGIYIYDIEKEKEVEVVSDERYNSECMFLTDSSIVFLSTWEKLEENEKIFEYKGIYTATRKLLGYKIKQILSEKYYGFTNLRVSNEIISYSSFKKGKPGRAIFIHKTGFDYSFEELKAMIENL